jgi:hypothetical protein
MDLSTITNTFTTEEQAILLRARDILMQGTDAQEPMSPEWYAMGKAYHGVAQVIGYPTETL